jgi:hypothetical protein
MRKTLDWKHFRISMFEVEAIPHSFIPEVWIGLSIALSRECCLWRVLTSVQVANAFWQEKEK